MNSKTGKVLASVYIVIAVILIIQTFLFCNKNTIDACEFPLAYLSFPASIPIGLIMLFANMETPTNISPFQQQTLLYFSFIASSLLYIVILYSIGAWIEQMRKKSSK